MTLALSCADFTFPLLPHKDALRLIAMLGFNGVDIGIFGGRSHVRPDDILKNVANAAKELDFCVRSEGLEFADIFLIGGKDFHALAPNHPDSNERRKARDLFERTLELSARCNARHMSSLPGVHWEIESRNDSMQRCAEELSWRIDRALQVGVTFSIEPHAGSIVATPTEVLELIRMVPGLTLTLDYGHFVSRDIGDDDVEPLVQYASHFHARAARSSRLQAPIKDNSIDFARVLREMHRTQYSGYLSIEYVWIDWEHCNEVDNLSETILMRDLLLREQP